VLWHPGDVHLQFIARSLQIGAITPVREVCGGSWSIGYGFGPRPPPMPEAVLYAGTADPADRSHVRFTCRLYDEQYLFDGYLNPDGRFVLSLTSHGRVAMPPSTRP